jgi:hypothetical protein
VVPKKDGLLQSTEKGDSGVPGLALPLSPKGIIATIKKTAKG